MYGATRQAQRLADNFLSDVDDFQRASRAADRRAMSHFETRNAESFSTTVDHPFGRRRSYSVIKRSFPVWKASSVAPSVKVHKTFHQPKVTVIGSRPYTYEYYPPSSYCTPMSTYDSPSSYTRFMTKLYDYSPVREDNFQPSYAAPYSYYDYYPRRVNSYRSNYGDWPINSVSKDTYPYYRYDVNNLPTSHLHASSPPGLYSNTKLYPSASTNYIDRDIIGAKVNGYGPGFLQPTGGPIAELRGRIKRLLCRTYGDPHRFRYYPTEVVYTY